jgi:hypothetical protein
MAALLGDQGNFDSPQKPAERNRQARQLISIWRQVSSPAFLSA